MNKNEILNVLKTKTKNVNLKLPEKLAIEIKDNVLSLEMTRDGLVGNMQTNASAFEGWAMTIKSLMKEEICKVEICWSHVSAKGADLNHYRRFLYRLIKFTQSYSWAKEVPLDEEAKEDFNQIKGELDSHSWVLNFPTKNATESAQHDEAKFERSLVDVLSGESGHQLPMGLFLKEKSQSNERTPGHGSQIDLWSFDNGTFTVYELKVENNRSVGIISELMFYVNVVKDLMDGIVKFDKEAKNQQQRNFAVLYDAISKGFVNEVEGVFLTNVMHPLISCNKQDFFSLINDNARNIHYKQMGYKIGDVELVKLPE